jgi:hypothetical protein
MLPDIYKREIAIYLCDIVKENVPYSTSRRIAHHKLQRRPPAPQNHRENRSMLHEIVQIIQGTPGCPAA